MASNYPTGVTGREVAIAGTDDEDVDDPCPLCGGDHDRINRNDPDSQCPRLAIHLQMDAELAAGELEDQLAEANDPENGYQRDAAWWTRNGPTVKRLIDAVIAAETAIEEARSR